MVRETSREAYNALKNSGALSRLRWETYEYLFKFGPATQHDITQYYVDRTGKICNHQQRFKELEVMGLIRPLGTIREEGSSRTLWDVTSRSKPLPLPQKATRKELIDGIKKAVEVLDLQKKIRSLSAHEIDIKDVEEFKNKHDDFLAKWIDYSGD